MLNPENGHCKSRTKPISKKKKSKEDSMYTVYQHVNKINGKMYIGITKRKPEERWGKDGINYKSTPHFYSAIQKYGWDNFEHNILYTDCNKNQACILEKQLIKKHRTQDKRFGYNIFEGGDCPSVTPEIRQKMSKSMMENKNGLNHPCSEEKKKKISDAQKGRHLTDEHKKKLSNAAKKRHTPCSETKRKTLQNRHPNMKKVYCFETNTVYKSVQECARQLSLQPTLVTKVCKHKLHTTGGYHLEYYIDIANV